MVPADAADSPLEALAAGDEATQAFKLLGNETRLAILVALWEQYAPYSAENAMRFSELRTRVGSTDSGRFNYHLEQLTSHFVDATDDGYELTEAGLKFVRAVIAGAGIEDRSLEPQEVDTTCTLCGGAVEVAYENGMVYILCTECDGLWPSDDTHQTGHLGKFALDPAGLSNRTPNEIYAAGWVQTFQRLYNMIEGVCPLCSGRVERSLDICEDHVADGTCPTCDRRTRVIARLCCTVCKDAIQTTLGGVAKYHPAVVAFCYTHDLELQYGFNELSHIVERLERTRSDVEQLSTDPPRVRITTEIDEASLWLELDENLAVVDVEPWPPQAASR